MRYDIYEDLDPIDPEVRWFVTDGPGTNLASKVMFGGTETEAKIVLFALNAIADGFQLKAETGSPFGDALSGDQYQLREYDGPTEGVKP